MKFAIGVGLPATNALRRLQEITTGKPSRYDARKPSPDVIRYGFPLPLKAGRWAGVDPCGDVSAPYTRSPLSEDSQSFDVAWMASALALV